MIFVGQKPLDGSVVESLHKLYTNSSSIADTLVKMLTTVHISTSKKPVANERTLSEALSNDHTLSFILNTPIPSILKAHGLPTNMLFFSSGHESILNQFMENPLSTRSTHLYLKEHQIGYAQPYQINLLYIPELNTLNESDIKCLYELLAKNPHLHGFSDQRSTAVLMLALELFLQFRLIFLESSLPGTNASKLAYLTHWKFTKDECSQALKLCFKLVLHEIYEKLASDACSSGILQLSEGIIPSYKNWTQDLLDTTRFLDVCSQQSAFCDEINASLRSLALIKGDLYPVLAPQQTLSRKKRKSADTPLHFTPLKSIASSSSSAPDTPYRTPKAGGGASTFLSSNSQTPRTVLRKDRERLLAENASLRRQFSEQSSLSSISASSSADVVCPPSGGPPPPPPPPPGSLQVDTFSGVTKRINEARQKRGLAPIEDPKQKKSGNSLQDAVTKEIEGRFEKTPGGGTRVRLKGRVRNAELPVTQSAPSVLEGSSASQPTLKSRDTAPQREKSKLPQPTPEFLRRKLRPTSGLHPAPSEPQISISSTTPKKK